MNKSCMSSPDGYKLFCRALLDTLLLFSWRYLLILLCLHLYVSVHRSLLSKRIFNNLYYFISWVFLHSFITFNPHASAKIPNGFMLSTRLLKRREKGEKKAHELETYAHRLRDKKRNSPIAKEIGRENGEGRMEHRANYVLWTGLSDCLESSGKKVLSLRLAAWSGPCTPAQAASSKHAASFLQPACVFFTCASRPQSWCISLADTTAPSTQQKDAAVWYRIFHGFVRLCCRPLVFTDSGCFIMHQNQCQYAPIGWKDRNAGGERRVMSLQQILREATAAVMYFQLGRTGSLQRELH